MIFHLNFIFFRLFDQVVYNLIITIKSLPIPKLTWYKIKYHHLKAKVDFMIFQNLKILPYKEIFFHRHMENSQKKMRCCNISCIKKTHSKMTFKRLLSIHIS